MRQPEFQYIIFNFNSNRNEVYGLPSISSLTVTNL